MAYFPITEKGEEFIHYVCDKTGTNNLSGNYGPMPYTYPLIKTKIWESNALYPPDNKRKIANGIELAEAIIYWYNFYAEKFQLDANVLAAQAFCESSYKLWIYAPFSPNSQQPTVYQSTASGLNQIITTTAWSIIIGNTVNNTLCSFTTEEIAKITKGFVGNPIPQPNLETSWQVGLYLSGPPQPSVQIGWANRPIYHQNAIDNPDIMIKAQCAYIKNIANKCNSLTSSTIMCYYQGEYEKKSYPETIAAVQAGAAGTKGATAGINYVLKIFGVLGDKDNFLAAQGLERKYKPAGYYFGYDSYMDAINESKNLKLGDPYIGYKTTLA